MLDHNRIRDISPEVLDDNGRMRILPAAYWETTTPKERGLFGHLNGIYSFPTTELVEFLRERFGDMPAIEIGSGNGVLAAELGIPATDNRMQERDPWKTHYERCGQPIVPYGTNVKRRDALAAVRHHKPFTVVACWVTHKYDIARHAAGGNVLGVDEEKVLAGCGQYIVVGNERTHAGKVIWNRPHDIIYPPWVFSRALNGQRDFIATWNGAKLTDQRWRRGR